MSILVLAPLAVRSGYGTLARGLTSALACLCPGTVAVDLTDFPGGRLRLGAELSSLITPAPIMDRPWLRIDVPWRGQFPRPRHGPSLLYTMFEAGPLPPGWALALKSLDEVVVPSGYCAGLFTEAGCASVRVVRPGIDPRFSPSAPPLRLDARSVVFLFVGEFTHRKGIDILLRAYSRAFGAADEVTLVVKTWSSRLGPDAIEEAVHASLREISASPPHTVFMHGMLPDTLLPSLYTAATALVMPSRSEGFGLPAAEAQACGVPVIATDATGLSESARAPSAYRLRTAGARPARSDDLPWDFYDGRSMPEPDEDHLVDILRYIYEHPDAAKCTGLAGSEAHHQRPWRQAAAELLDVMTTSPAIPQGGPYE